MQGLLPFFWKKTQLDWTSNCGRVILKSITFNVQVYVQFKSNLPKQFTGMYPLIVLFLCNNKNKLVERGKENQHYKNKF
jgi:hypothetical protein